MSTQQQQQQGAAAAASNPSSPIKKDKFRPVCCEFLDGHCPNGASTCAYEHADMNAKPCQYGENCKKHHYHRHWIPDEDFEHCAVCKGKFTVFQLRMRHHCRYCGKVVCGECLDRDFKPWPVCTTCKQ